MYFAKDASMRELIRLQQLRAANASRGKREHELAMLERLETTAQVVDALETVEPASDMLPECRS